jgi:hypothetical protein
VRIADFLSAENFSAAAPGTEVRVLYEPTKKRAYLENDIERYNKQESWIFPGPLFFFIAAGGLLVLWVGRRSVGLYEDGQEYLIAGDRVKLDDKDLPVSRLALNTARLFMR